MAKAGLAIGIGLGIAALLGVGVVLAKTKGASSQSPAPGGVMLNAVQLPSTASGASDAITKILGTPTVTTWAAPSGRTYTVMEWTKTGMIAALLYTAVPNTLWAVQVIYGQMPTVLLNVLPDPAAQSDVTNFVATQLMKLPTGSAPGAPQGVPVPAMNLPTDPVAAATMISALLGQPIQTTQATGGSNRQYTLTQWRSSIAIPATGSQIPQNITVVMIYSSSPQTLWVVQKDSSGNQVQLLNVLPDAQAQIDIAGIAKNL
jgi:hypothetical protein